MVFRSFLEISLQFPAGHMKRSLNGRCTLDSTWMVTKLGVDGKSAHFLSFALLSALSEHFLQKNYLKFSLLFLAGHMEHLIGHCFINLARFGCRLELFVPLAPKSSWFKPLPCRTPLKTTLDPPSSTTATTAFTTTQVPLPAISASQANTRTSR
jgi:hypothetical protein